MTAKHTSRLTLDMPSEDHSFLKMACAKLGIPMRLFILVATFEKMEALEDKLLAEKAKDVLEQIEKGESKTIPWDEAKKQLKKNAVSHRNRRKSTQKA